MYGYGPYGFYGEEGYGEGGSYYGAYDSGALKAKREKEAEKVGGGQGGHRSMRGPCMRGLCGCGLHACGCGQCGAALHALCCRSCGWGTCSPLHARPIFSRLLQCLMLPPTDTPPRHTLHLITPQARGLKEQQEFFLEQRKPVAVLQESGPNFMIVKVEVGVYWRFSGFTADLGLPA